MNNQLANFNAYDSFFDLFTLSKEETMGQSAQKVVKRVYSTDKNGNIIPVSQTMSMTRNGMQMTKKMTCTKAGLTSTKTTYIKKVEKPKKATATAKKEVIKVAKIAKAPKASKTVVAKTNADPFASFFG